MQGFPEAIPQTPEGCAASIHGKCILGTDEIEVVEVELDNGELDSIVETGRCRDSKPGLYIGELVSKPGTGRKGEAASSPTNGRCNGLPIDCNRSRRGCSGLDSGVNAELPEDGSPPRLRPG